MTSSEGSRPGIGAVERKPLATPEEIRKAFSEPPPPEGGGRPAAPMRPVPEVSTAGGLLELGLAVTGIGLTVFMVMHLGLLLTVLVGAQTMDSLASFLERYYLLQSVAPVLVIALIVHVVLSLRKIPVSLRQQVVLLNRTRAMRHFDTFTWGIQMVTGIAIAALVSIHLWVILVDLPIEAAKSGARVSGIYLWLYIPFLVAVESHISAGIYRVAVKWGINRRRVLHAVLNVWTVAALALGAAILVALYRLGGSA